MSIQSNYIHNVQPRTFPSLGIEQWFHNLLGVLIKAQPILTPSYGTNLPSTHDCYEDNEWLCYKASEILREHTIISRYSRVNLDEQMRKNGTSAIISYVCDENDTRNIDSEKDQNNCKGCITKVFRIFITVCERDHNTKLYGEDLAKKLADLMTDMIRFGKDEIRVESLDRKIYGFHPCNVDIDSPVALPEPSMQGEGGYYTVSLTFAIPMSVYLTVTP